MPSREVHERFDLELQYRGCIVNANNGRYVHRMMDRGSQKFGSSHRGQSPHTVEDIRKRISELRERYKLDQACCTDCVRIAYGHIALDEADGDFRKAMARFRARAWDRTFFHKSIGESKSGS